MIVAADGVNSIQRSRYADTFKPHIDVRKCRFIWLGTEQKFPAFTFAFENTEHGWFQIHAYQFSTDLSTVIVETREETWKAHGLDRYSTEQSIEFCEQLFGKYLGGHRLMSNARHLRGSAWLNFNRVLCERWHHGNLVLIGDAAHTAHFGIGSGTKLAMEDAMSLVSQVAHAEDVGAGLERYRAERNLEALKLQSAARNRMEWFENVARYTHLEPQQFAYSLLTASQRIGHANLRLRDPRYVDAVERDLARRSGLERAAAADVPAAALGIPAAGQSRRRLADGAVPRRGRRAGRLALDALRGAGRRGRGLDRDRNDLRGARRAHHAGLHRHVERGASSRLGSGSSISCMATRLRRSRCSSAMPDARAPRSSGGRRWIIRCRPAIGR